MNNEFNLHDQTILVTGANGLIGKEACDAFASQGANLVITDIGPPSALKSFANSINEKYGVQTLAVAADLTLEEPTTQLVTEAITRFGKVDTLLNLAAIDAKLDADKAGNLNPSRFENFPLDLWEKSLAINATGLIRITQEVVRHMLQRSSGNIINVASTYSLVSPNQTLYKYDDSNKQIYKPIDYVGSKSMVPNFTRYLATLYAKEGIRANYLVPHAIENKQPEEFKQNFQKLSPIGRMCDVGELRGPLVFLASNASSYMTGASLVIDGGWTAW
ncbi:SDR family oxidoreductase [Puniceicoccaceae bacterium K14]|nr:SDR family oxidoreductase [Puniceicoccaceae bacterium K14]